MKKYIYLVIFEDGSKIVYSIKARGEGSANCKMYDRLDISKPYEKIELLTVCDELINM